MNRFGGFDFCRLGIYHFFSRFSCSRSYSHFCLNPDSTPIFHKLSVYIYKVCPSHLYSSSSKFNSNFPSKMSFNPSWM